MRGCVAVWIVLLVAGVSPLGAADAPPPDFWKHWGDGQAELNGYRLKQPRYGAVRDGTAVLIFVTEDFSDSLRVKADPGRHPKTDVYPVLKLNAVRDFQTGIYHYDVMTSAFARVAAGWPVAKVSFSSQEWCGLVYHHLTPRNGTVSGVFHSYFDGEADGTDELAQPADGVFEDVLPIVLRGWQGAYLPAGQKKSVPYLPSLLSSRLGHKRLAWGRAEISRAAAPSTVVVPAGRFQVTTWTVAEQGGRTTTYQFEVAPPYRLVRWATDAGEEGALTGSTRLPYWKLNAPGGEKHLRALGLGRTRVVE
jgi:hypothetical protein